MTHPRVLGGSDLLARVLGAGSDSLTRVLGGRRDSLACARRDLDSLTRVLGGFTQLAGA